MPNQLDTKLVEISKDINNLVSTSKQVIIKTAEDIKQATEFLTKIVARKKRIEELRLFFTKPLNDQVKAINAQFKSSSQPLEIIESEIKSKMIEYRKIEAEKIRKQQEKELEKQRKEFQAEQDRKMKEAEMLKGKEKKEVLKEIKQEEFIPVPSAIKQESQITSDAGSVKTRKTWKFDIVDEGLVPRKYLEVNEKAIREAVRQGIREIPGVNIYEEENINVFANN